MILALTFSYGICKRWLASVQKITLPSFFHCQLISLAVIWRNKIKSAVGRIEVKLAAGLLEKLYYLLHSVWFYKHHPSTTYIVKPPKNKHHTRISLEYQSCHLTCISARNPCRVTSDSRKRLPSAVVFHLVTFFMNQTLLCRGFSH